jgi:hypothetical protein
MTTNNFTIRTPHAAVLIWNYKDRVTGSGISPAVVNTVEPMLISTLSCISITTSKSKGAPQGEFQIVLAPLKNWVSTITAGSWCVIMMSNEPVTEKSLTYANKKLVKMIGKIDTVRVNTSVDGEGARHTQYTVSGVDWGHIFNNTVYIDNLIGDPGAQESQGAAAAIAIRDWLLGGKFGPTKFTVSDNLKMLMHLFGKDMGPSSVAGHQLNRIANAVYDLVIPNELCRFLGITVRDEMWHGLWKDDGGYSREAVKTTPDPYPNATPAPTYQDSSGPEKVPLRQSTLTGAIKVVVGRLTGVNKYDDKDTSYGFINPFSLQGAHTFWQILLENSNSAMNEMFNEIEWLPNGKPQLTLYNRTKPFSVSGLTESYASGGKSTDTSEIALQRALKGPANSTSMPASAPTTLSDYLKPEIADPLRSLFTRLPTIYIDPNTVLAINAGTNWRDKYNFIEIRPQYNEFQLPYGNAIAQKVQVADETAFAREGFRPLMLEIKQFPGEITGQAFDDNSFRPWMTLLREWYFDTHRLLNGTITMTGSTEYIPVGSNIKFPLGLINPTKNMTLANLKGKKEQYVLAHVENVQHAFGVGGNGERTFTTTVQFVRGIFVDQGNRIVQQGVLDQDVSSMNPSEDRNRANTISTSESDDPDPDRVRGT